MLFGLKKDNAENQFAKVIAETLGRTSP